MRIDDLAGRSATTTGEQSDTFAFGMDDPRLIFKILREKMYSNPKKAAIQEYLCNARDAHRENHIEDRPVEVIFPDFDGSELSIRDYGMGIPRNMMEKVFVKYGTSTKRGSDRFTGGWGLGCKTGFAVGDSFGVVSITDDEDGIRRKRTYLAFLDEGEAGSMSLLVEEETDEETGLQINLPVNSWDLDEFAGYVEKTTEFWNVRPVIKNWTIKYSEMDYYVRGDRWGILRSSSWNAEAYIILDGIRYVFKKNSLSGIELNEKQTQFVNKPFILFFNTGELTPTPNREDITYDIQAKMLIASRLEEIADSFHRSLKERMDELFSDPKVDPLTLRSRYEDQSRDLENYAPHLLNDVKRKLLPKTIEGGIESPFRVWSFHVDLHVRYGDCPISVGKEITGIPVGKNKVYVLDYSASSKPTRQRVYGLYHECEEHPEQYNRLVIDTSPEMIYVIRFRSLELKKKFFDEHPSFTALLHQKTLTDYTARTLGLPKKATRRGGGTEIRVLNRATVTSKGAYQSFVPFSALRGGQGYAASDKSINPVEEYQIEKRMPLEEIEQGVYVLLKDGACYSPDFKKHLGVEMIRPTPERRRRRRRSNSDSDDSEVQKIVTTKPVMRPPPSLACATHEFNSVPDTVPIYGVFEKGYELIKDNPRFISLRDYHRIRAERFRHKYQELIDKGRVFHYPLEQACFTGLTPRVFTEFLLSIPKWLLPSHELREWWEFQKKYPNLTSDLGSQYFKESHTYHSIEPVPMQITLKDDNRLIWFASALATGKMTRKQKMGFLSLLHTTQLAK